MKRLSGMLAGIALLVSCGAGQAATFTQSDFAGTGSFGTATAACQNALCTDVHVDVNMDPNILLQTGSHFLFTLSLAGSGVIDASSIVLAGSSITVLPKTSPASYQNSPFRFFNTGISADCGNGGSSGCGSTLAFDIDNFSGFLFATEQFNGFNIIAAADVLLTNCTGACTGVVGLTGDLTPTPFDVPGETPIPGAVWLFGGGLGLLSMFGRRKKKAPQAWSKYPEAA